MLFEKSEIFPKPLPLCGSGTITKITNKCLAWLSEQKKWYHKHIECKVMPILRRAWMYMFIISLATVPLQSLHLLWCCCPHNIYVLWRAWEIVIHGPEGVGVKHNTHLPNKRGGFWCWIVLKLKGSQIEFVFHLWCADLQVFHPFTIFCKISWSFGNTDMITFDIIRDTNRL